MSAFPASPVTSLASFVDQSRSSVRQSEPLTLDRCVGKRNYGLARQTNWFGFRTRPISDDTRCQYCATHLLMKGEPNLYALASFSDRIDCDSLDDAGLSKLSSNGFLFGVTSPDENVPFLVHPEKAEARRQGVLVVEMPAVQDYSVFIDPQNTRVYDKWYTFEMSVGDRKVLVNGGKTLYYNGRTKVSGFSTGSSDSFRFVAEQKRADFAHEAGINAPNTNLITIRVNTFRREQKPKPVVFHPMSGWGYETYLNGNTYRGPSDGYFSNESRSLGSRGEGCPAPASKNVKKGIGSGSSAAAAMPGAFRGPDVEEGPCSTGFAAATGGSTVSGHNYVPDLRTESTEDTFVPVDNFVVTIQLIHVGDGRYQEVLRADGNSFAAYQRHLEEQRRAEEQRRLAEQNRVLAQQRTLLVGTGPQQPVGYQAEVKSVPMIPLQQQPTCGTGLVDLTRCTCMERGPCGPCGPCPYHMAMASKGVDSQPQPVVPQPQPGPQPTLPEPVVPQPAVPQPQDVPQPTTEPAEMDGFTPL